MTSEQLDRVFDVRDAIEKAVTTLVDYAMVKAGLTPEQETLVRTLLTENYRFWK